jgi:hypothetical protein
MKIAVLLSAFFLSNLTSSGQIAAVTDKGDEVVLSADGTWKYVNKDEAEGGEIRTSKIKFERAKEASFHLKSTVVSAVFYLNPKKWSFKKSEAAEYEFQSKEKGKDAYGMVISERIKIPLENLKEIALENARKVAPDIKLSKEEYRVVNGTRLLYMQMDGTIKGIKFSYLGYYHSNESGTVQFLTFTAQSLLKEYQKEMEELLNGLVVKSNAETEKDNIKGEMSR